MTLLPDHDGASGEIDEHFSEARLLAWAYDLGIDLRDVEDLASATAIGLTTLLWRNTTLENIHAGGESQAIFRSTGDDWERFDEWFERRYAEFLPLVDPERFCDSGASESDRVAALVAGRKLGIGIPDDVMFRANTATAAQLRTLLMPHLADVAAGREVKVDTDVDEDPWYLAVATSALAKRDRPMVIGDAVITAEELLGTSTYGLASASGWDTYYDDVYVKGARPAMMHRLLGPTRALWYVALSGASYSSGLYPLPAWRAGVDDWLDTIEVLDPALRARRETIREHPYALDTASAYAVIADPALKQAVGASQEAARQRLGALPDNERFFPFLAAF